MKEIDARGLACPAPVLETKAALEAHDIDVIEVIVDNAAARENVSRFLESNHFVTTVAQKGDDFRVVGKRGEGTSAEESGLEKPETDLKKIMMMIATDRIGHGDDDLGKKLMISYISTLKEMGPELWRLIFVNNGVKLTIDTSAVLPTLKELEADGLKILVCGTCLTHFNLMDRKQVGETTNMLDIVTSMQLADKVVNI